MCVPGAFDCREAGVESAGSAIAAPFSRTCRYSSLFCFLWLLLPALAICACLLVPFLLSVCVIPPVLSSDLLPGSSSPSLCLGVAYFCYLVIWPTWARVILLGLSAIASVRRDHLATPLAHYLGLT